MQPIGARDFFVSYNKDDKEIAAWIAWILEQHGYSVFFAEWDFRGNFVANMDLAHRNAERTIAVLSDSYFESGFALAEWTARFAQDPGSQEDRLIPVKVSPLTHESILASIMYADLTGCDEATANKRLLNRVAVAVSASQRRKPQASPPFPVLRSERPSFPRRQRVIHNLPLAYSHFVGREDSLALIVNGFQERGKAAIVQIITGLGGIGKTQTALAYAYQNLESYHLIWLIRAEEPTVAEEDLSLLADKLMIERAGRERSVLMQEIREYLESTSGWLLIFDNAESPQFIASFIPRLPSGHIIVTSRSRGWADFHAVELEVMKEDESLRLMLGESCSPTHPQYEDALALCNDLGRLPLALAQAHAYIRETGIEISTYRQYLIDYRPSILGAGHLPEYPEAVATTWSISLQKASSAAEWAVPLLCVMAFLAPDNISREFFVSVGSTDVETDSIGTLEFDEGVSALRRYSLILAREGKISVHRLVQAVVQDSLTEDQAREYASAAVYLVFRKVPMAPAHDPSTWSIIQVLYSHLLSVCGWAERLEVAADETATLLDTAGLYRMLQGDLEGAASLLERAVHLAEKSTFLANLALVYKGMGRVDEAENLYRKALSVIEESATPDEVNRGVILSNLGRLCFELERYDEARILLERAIDMGESLHGRDRMNLPFWLNNLALFYRATSQPKLAEQTLHRAIKMGKEVLGDPHHDVAVWHRNLAHIYSDAEDYKAAEDSARKALSMYSRLVPEDHWWVTSTKRELAGILDRQSRKMEADALREEAGRS